MQKLFLHLRIKDNYIDYINIIISKINVKTGGDVYKLYKNLINLK